MGFLYALDILLIALKLCGVISIPWIAVTAPIWGGILAFLGVMAVCMLIAAFG